MGLFSKKQSSADDDRRLQDDVETLRAVLRFYKPGTRVHFGSPTRCPHCGDYGFVEAVNKSAGVSHNHCFGCQGDWVITLQAIQYVETNGLKALDAPRAEPVLEGVGPGLELAAPSSNDPETALTPSTSTFTRTTMGTAPTSAAPGAPPAHSSPATSTDPGTPTTPARSSWGNDAGPAVASTPPADPPAEAPPERLSVASLLAAREAARGKTPGASAAAALAATPATSSEAGPTAPAPLRPAASSASATGATPEAPATAPRSPDRALPVAPRGDSTGLPPMPIRGGATRPAPSDMDTSGSADPFDRLAAKPARPDSAGSRDADSTPKADAATPATAATQSRPASSKSPATHRPAASDAAPTASPGPPRKTPTASHPETTPSGKTDTTATGAAPVLPAPEQPEVLPKPASIFSTTTHAAEPEAADGPPRTRPAGSAPAADTPASPTASPPATRPRPSTPAATPPAATPPAAKRPRPAAPDDTPAPAAVEPITPATVTRGARSAAAEAPEVAGDPGPKDDEPILLDAPTPAPVPAGTTLRLLVVEDNPFDLALIEEVAEAANEELLLTSATTRNEAERIAATASFDIILLELDLPDSAGIPTLLEWQHSAVSGAPVIVLIGHSEAGVIREAKALGAFHVIQKSHLAELADAGAAGADRLVRLLRSTVKKHAAMPTSGGS